MQGAPPNGGPDYDNCIHLISEPIADRMGQMLSNAEVCQGMQQASLQNGGNIGVVDQNFQACMKDVLDPDFQSNRTMDLLVPAIDFLLGLAAGLAVATIGGVATAACAISEICALAVMAITPDGAAFTPWMTLAGIGVGGAFTTARVAAVDDALVDSEALDTRSSAIEFGNGPCKAIALGWQKYLGDPTWLDVFAMDKGALPYTEWLSQDINKLQWYNELEYYLTNGETTIYVCLDGIPEGEVEAAVAAGAAADGPNGPRSASTRTGSYSRSRPRHRRGIG